MTYSKKHGVVEVMIQLIQVSAMFILILRFCLRKVLMIYRKECLRNATEDACYSKAIERCKSEFK